MSSRIQNEKVHGQTIAANAEEIWNWDSPTGRVRSERRANYFLSKGGFKATDVLLEIGCGTGLFTQKVYNKTGANITAIDISEHLLEQAALKVPAAKFILDDAMRTKFPSDSFDGIYGSSVIHHLEEQKVWKEIFRLLKPGGKMVFAEPNMLNPQIFIQKNVPFIKKWLGDSPDESALVKWKTFKDLENLGFMEIEILPYDFLHPITPSFFIPIVSKIGGVFEKIPLVREIAGSVIISAKKPN